MRSFVLRQLLGKDSHDIDIALDDMLGKQFCEKVNEYLKCIGEETSGIGVIQRYPITQLLKLFLLSRYNSTVVVSFLGPLKGLLEMSLAIGTHHAESLVFES